MLQPSQLDALFFGTRGNRQGSILIVGEAWGENEAHQQKPFVGASGKELDLMLRQAGIPLEACLYTNVVNLRPQRNNMKTLLVGTKEARDAKLETERGLFLTDPIREGLTKLYALIDHVRPKIILAVGNWPLWALTDSYKVKDDKGYKTPTGIDSYRGSMLFTRQGLFSKPIPVLPTYHPAAILRQWKWRHIAVRDFQRASAHHNGSLHWSDRRDFKWLIKPTVREVRNWVDHYLSQTGGMLELVLDLETAAYQIHIFGVKSPYDGTCLCVPFFHLRGDSRTAVYSQQEFISIGGHLRRLLTDPRVRLVGQNLIYDIQFLSWFFCYTPRVADDTMVIQYVLSPGERKGLDFLASVYATHYVYWKEDRKVSLASESTELGCEYNCRDLEYTFEVWRATRPLIDKTGKTRQYEKRIDLLHRLFRMMQRGVKIDTQLRRRQAGYLELQIEEVEDWIDGAMPEFLKPPREKTKTGKWKTAPWYKSDKQLRTVLYDNLRLRPVYDEKTERPTLAKGALEILAERYPDLKVLFNMLVLLRSLYTYKENFYDSLVDRDGRMRCAYNPAGPITLRLSSSENVFGGGHNLQNVPRERNPLDFFNIIEELT